MISSKPYSEDWEAKKNKLISSFFEKEPRSTMIEENEEIPLEMPSPRRRSESPLPQLIIEKVQKLNRHDEPEEFYEKLQVTVQSYIDRLKRRSSCESRTTYLSSSPAVVDDDIRSSLLESSCGRNIDQANKSDEPNYEMDQDSKERRTEEINTQEREDFDAHYTDVNQHENYAPSNDDSGLENQSVNQRSISNLETYQYYKLYYPESNNDGTKNKSKETLNDITEKMADSEDEVEGDELFPGDIASPILIERKSFFEKTTNGLGSTYASRQQDRGRPELMRRQLPNTTVDSFEVMSACSDTNYKEKFENLADRALTPETESITFTPEMRPTRISSLNISESASSLNSPSPPKRRRISCGVQTSGPESHDRGVQTSGDYRTLNFYFRFNF